MRELKMREQVKSPGEVKKNEEVSVAPVELTETDLERVAGSGFDIKGESTADTTTHKE